MARPTVKPTGQERLLGDNQLIVSKTDTRGVVTYCNRVFLDIADYALSDVIGQQHNLVRHPDMPRCVFKFLWDRISSGHELFAYVVNMAKNGDHYWVYAHVTPSYGLDGKISGYHSNRRAPRRDVVTGVIAPLYRLLCQEEARHESPKAGMEAGEALLLKVLKDKGTDYDRLIHSL